MYREGFYNRTLDTLALIFPVITVKSEAIAILLHHTLVPTGYIHSIAHRNQLEITSYGSKFKGLFRLTKLLWFWPVHIMDTLIEQSVICYDRTGCIY